MKPFFETQTLESVLDLMDDIGPLQSESVELDGALGRSLAGELRAVHDLPGFPRATMDGYAVRSRETFGAGETSPAYLALVGEVVMGQEPGFEVGKGKCGRIGTGGMLPRGADAVVMVEHTREVDGHTIEVTKSLAPGSNVLGSKDDAEAGQVLLAAGTRIRPQDVGMMASLGVREVEVVRRPRAGIISTGDEVVEVEEAPGPGQVRDVNTHTLGAQVVGAGGEPVVLGLVPDEAQAIHGKVAGSLEGCDLTLLSGGSSVGVRDLTAEVFQSFDGARLLVHGVSVAPGKPFIWVRVGEKNLLGLPGQVASCMVSFHLFVEPIMERLLGREARSFTRFGRLGARLTRNVPAAPGREVYQRVRLERDAEGWKADPVFGKSGLLRTLTQGQGLVRVPLGCEGLDKGAVVEVLLFP